MKLNLLTLAAITVCLAPDTGGGSGGDGGATEDKPTVKFKADEIAPVVPPAVPAKRPGRPKKAPETAVETAAQCPVALEDRGFDPDQAYVEKKTGVRFWLLMQDAAANRGDTHRLENAEKTWMGSAAEFAQCFDRE